VCSDEYTTKANNRTGGAGYETQMAAQRYYHSDVNHKEKFIPVVRDNSLPPDKKIPAYLGKTLFIDMDNENWEGEPLQKLIISINRHR
jgi:hypothetical protein